MFESSKILIIDDQPDNIEVVRIRLEYEGYTDINGLTDSEQAIPWILNNNPDLILLDVMMPKKDGFEVLEELRSLRDNVSSPVLIFTSSQDEEIKQRAFELGAQDFITKPLNQLELNTRVKNILLVKFFNDQLKNTNNLLQNIVFKKTRELENSYLDIIYRLGRAAEYKDSETGKHVVRVSQYSAVLAETLGLPDNDIILIMHTSPMHDIGKIGIPDNILLKPGRLTREEKHIMQQHTLIGADIFINKNDDPLIYDDNWLSGLKFLNTQKVPLLHMAATIALTHHERWDGNGYPLGLTGEQIPLPGRIVAVADVYDALTTKRPYKSAFSQEKCLKMIDAERGKHFDPMVVDAFFESLDKILFIQKKYADKKSSSTPFI
ncbi:response regulator [bacterium]|nr:response regulator [bacterium]